MRIRQVKPAFWSDSVISELDDATKLFYIGLWMTADDTGMFRWNTAEIARDLYGYGGRSRRERRVEAMRDALVALGRVVIHDCGHAEIPTMANHQRLAGPTKRVEIDRDEHRASCGSSGKPKNSGTSDTRPREPAGTRGYPPGKEREREREKVASREPATHGQISSATPTTTSHDESRMKPTPKTTTPTTMAIAHPPDYVRSAGERQLWGVAAAANNWLPSKKQLAVLVDIAVQRQGFDWVCDKLREAEGDPYRFVVDADSRVRAEGEARADQQEAESAKWRDVNASRSFRDLVADPRLLPKRPSKAAN